jgi:hypothetical protein
MIGVSPRPRTLATALLAVIVGGASCHRMTPAADRRFTIVGAIVTVDAQLVQLRHKSGQIVDIAIDPATRVVRRGETVRPGDLEPGMRVVVLYRRVDGVWMADEIRLFRAAQSRRLSMCC